MSAVTGRERRRFLKALGAGAASLPFFGLLERQVARAAGEPPLRLLLIHSGWGGPWDYLRPSGITSTTRDVPLTPAMLTYPGSILEPLKDFTAKMLVLEGMAVTPALLPTDKANPIASRTHMVGHENTEPNRFTGSAINDANNDYVPRSPSLDFVLGKQLGGSNAVRSLQIGIGCGSGTVHSDTLSYNDGGQRQPGITRPADAWKALFGGVVSAPGATMSSPTAAARDAARQLSVVTAVESSVKRLRARLATTERAKLDEHLAALSDIEARLRAQSSGPSYAPVACDAPTMPAGMAPDGGFGTGDAIPENTRMHFDILVQAFACDRTRYVAARWGETGAGTLPFLFGTDVKDMHAEVAHQAGHENAGAGGVLARQRLAKVNNWYAQRLAEMMTRMQGVKEGSGTLLDNTLIVWTTDFGNEVHGGVNVPYVLLGGAQGKLRMGRYLNASTGPLNDSYPGNAINTYAPTNQLLVSIMNACGIAGNTFGSTEFGGPLKGLT
ncbi:MAG TPA: DUF1552 domain-containing protein [Polyangia bacterium]|nr:DUF1552 domain-containing protein [Polyangia bacterium]